MSFCCDHKDDCVELHRVSKYILCIPIILTGLVHVNNAAGTHV